MPTALRRRRLTAVMTAPAVSLASQLAGLIQVALLLLRGGASEATDAYFYLFGLGLTPTFMLISGVMYPQLINERGMTARALQTLRLATPLLGAGLVAAGAGWLQYRGRLADGLLPLTLVLLLNAVLQAKLYFRTTCAEASGLAVWSAGIALPSNAIACVVLLYPWSSTERATTAMASGLLIGNVALLIVMRARGVGSSTAPFEKQGAASRVRSSWFLARGVIGYGNGLVLASAAVLLPASSITLLNVASKVVAAVGSTFTNSVLPTLVHRSSSTPRAAQRFLRALMLVLSGAGAVALLLCALLAAKYLFTCAAIVLWMIASSAAAVSQRAAFRFLRARVFAPVLAWGVTVVAVVLLVSAQGHLTVDRLLLAYATMDAGAAVLLLLLLRDRLLAGLLGAAVLSLVLLAAR